MPKILPSINLIKDQKGDLIERTVNWSLSIGRILVIITELIALTAFLWRFGLDQQVIDLHTQTKQEQAIVAAFAKNEEQYRNLQDRLSLASNYLSVGEKNLGIFKDVLRFISTGITLNKIGLTDNAISMEINVDSVSTLSNFVNSLKSYPNIKSISLDKIETRTSNATIVVGITITLKPLENKYETKIK